MYSMMIIILTSLEICEPLLDWDPLRTEVEVPLSSTTFEAFWVRAAWDWKFTPGIQWRHDREMGASEESGKKGGTLHPVMPCFNSLSVDFLSDSLLIKSPQNSSTANHWPSDLAQRK